MAEFKISIKINRPVEIVYQAYVDPDNMLKWSTDLEKFEIVKGKFGEVGAIAHLHYRQKGRSNIMEDRLEYIEPGKKLISNVSGEGINVKVETTFNSLDGGTEIAILWNGKGTNFWLKILLPFLKGMIRNQAQSELDKFKKLVEEHGVKF